MSERGHKTLEHTADMGILGWGPSPREAFEEIALAMFELIVETEGLEATREIDLTCDGGELRELLVEFLNKLLLKADIEEMAFIEVRVDRLDKVEDHWVVAAKAGGVQKRDVKDKLLTEVKAATYYGAFVEDDGSGKWEAQCVVDL